MRQVVAKDLRARALLIKAKGDPRNERRIYRDLKRERRQAKRRQA